MTRHALVVGINQYPFLQDTSTSKAKSLKTPAGDAEAIAQLLEADDNFRVRRLPVSNIDGKKLQVDPNKQLTVQELEEAIAQLFLPESGKVPQKALLFFAGHGLRKQLGSFTQGFLATSDASPRKNQWGMPLRDLREILQESAVPQQVVWLDCCFSGELLNFKEADLGGQSSRRDHFLIAASRDSEVAYQQLDGEHGVLTGALLKGLDPHQFPNGEWLTDLTLADSVDKKLKAYYALEKIPQSQQVSKHGEPIKLIQGRSRPQLEPKDEEVKNNSQASEDPWERVWQSVPPDFELLDRKFFETQGQRGESRILKLRAATWSLIIQGNYIQRDQQDELLEIAEELENFNGISMLLIRGEPGAGKTALMRWSVYELFKQGQIILQKKTQNENFSWLQRLREFSERIGEQHFYVIVDDIFRDELILDELGQNQIQFPFTLIGTTRINEDQYESLDGLGYELEVLNVNPPSKAEKERILAKVCEDPDVEARLDAMIAAEQKRLMAAPAMLVLMLQLSEGTTFGQKLIEIIKELPSTEQRPVYQVYGVICSFYQHGIIVPLEVIPLCLPQFSLGAIQDIVDSIEGTELAGLVNTVSQDGSQGLGTIHELIAKTSIEQNYRPSSKDNPPYSRRSLERYLITAILAVDTKQLLIRSWVCHTLNRLAIIGEAELVRLVFSDCPNQVQSLQEKCGITEWFLWLKLYELLGLSSERERCINKILLIEPQISSEWIDLLSLIEKFGTEHQKQEAITKTAFWLLENLDDTRVRDKYLIFIKNYGNSKQRQEAIIDTVNWLQQHPDDSIIRIRYLWLINSFGTSAQKQKAITEASNWLESHLEDTTVRSGYLKLVHSSGTPERRQEALAQTANWIQENLDNIVRTKNLNLIRNPSDGHLFSQYLKLLTELGTLEQKWEAINQTAIWLEAHPENRMVRLQYLDLIQKQGTHYQQQKAINETAIWLQEHSDSRFNRRCYLSLVEKLGTKEQQREAIKNTAYWLQSHDDFTVRIHYFTILNKLGDSQLIQETINLIFDKLELGINAVPKNRYAFTKSLAQIETLGQLNKILDKFSEWIQKNPNNSLIRSQYLILIQKHGTTEQQQNAIETTAIWLQNQPDDWEVRTPYLVLIQKQGTLEQQQEAIREIAVWLQDHDDYRVRSQYLVLLNKQGTFDQQQEAIEKTTTWLQQHPDDLQVRTRYLVLLTKSGTPQQQQDAIQQITLWLQEYPDALDNPYFCNSYITLIEKQETSEQQRNNIDRALACLQRFDDWQTQLRYLVLVSRVGTYEQQQEAISQTAVWLQNHPCHVLVRTQYLVLMNKQGSLEQQQKAIAQTSTWLQAHPEDRSVRIQYLGLIEQQGTSEQQREAIEQTAIWLQDNPEAWTIYTKYIALIQKLGTSEQREAIEQVIGLQTHLEYSDDPYIVAQHLTFLQRLGTPEQRQQAIERTTIWLQDHPEYSDDPYIRVPYLALILRQGTPQQQHEAIQQTTSLFQAYPEHWGNLFFRSQYIELLKKYGTWQQQQRAIKQMASWLQTYPAHPDNLGIRPHYLELVKHQGTPQQKEEAVTQTTAWLQAHQDLGDQRKLASVLSNLGWLMQRMNRFNEAEEFLQRSQIIWKELNDQGSLAMVLNSLGVIQQRLMRFDEAVENLQRCYALCMDLNDQKGQAMALNSLGIVQQQLGYLDNAINAFQRSLEIGQQLDDQEHLAKVHTAMGKALLAHGNLEQAAVQLGKGFEIDVRLENRLGLGIVTPKLVKALVSLGRNNDALAYYQRALAISPHNQHLLKLRDQLSPRQPKIAETVIKRGKVKPIRRNAKGERYGHITPNDGSRDIYFREEVIAPDCFSKLTDGTLVEVEVEETPQGSCARSIKIIAQFKPL